MSRLVEGTKHFLQACELLAIPWVRFYRVKADHFTFDLPRLTDPPEEALLMADINAKGIAAGFKAPLADRWTGNFKELISKMWLL